MELVKCGNSYIEVEIGKVNGINVVTSREIARQLKKEHRRVLQDIRDKSLHRFVQWIIPSKYKAGNGQEYDEFLLTKEGFTMLVFNYEGYLEFKEAYINKFNEMEKTIKEKTEEEKIKELFPSAPANLIGLTAENIRENRKLKAEITHKEDVIIGLVDDIDLCSKRRRISHVVRFGSVDYRERYNLLYKEFEMKYKIDLGRRMKSEKVKSMKPKVQSKMDYIDRVLDKIPQLYEIACILFEADMKTIIKKFEK